MKTPSTTYQMLGNIISAGVQWLQTADIVTIKVILSAANLYGLH